MNLYKEDCTWSKFHDISLKTKCEVLIANIQLQNERQGFSSEALKK